MTKSVQTLFTPLERNKEFSTGSVLAEYLTTSVAENKKTSLFYDNDDDDIVMMTDAEKEAFAEMQSRLEQQCMSQYYYYCHNSSTSDPDSDCYDINYHHDGYVVLRDSEEKKNMEKGKDNAFLLNGQKGCSKADSVDIRLADNCSVGLSRRSSSNRCFDRSHNLGDSSLLMYSSTRRHRERQAWYLSHMDDELTFHPQINPTKVAPRYMNSAAQQTRKMNVEAAKAAEDLTFKPVVNRLNTSTLSDHLGRYLCMPVHKRLNRATTVSAPFSGRSVREEKQSRRCSKEKKGVFEAFLKRLEETNQRRERKLQQLALAQKSGLTFCPKLAPGTRQMRVWSAVARNINGQLTAREAPAPAEERHAPQINARSRAMRRGVNDLCVFERRRQERLRQLQAEREAAARRELSGSPALSSGSARLAAAIFGEDTTHEAIQRYLQRHARIRAAALLVTQAEKEREEVKELTFRPEVHPVPQYVHNIAQQLAMNKSFARKQPTPKPTFRFS